MAQSNCLPCQHALSQMYCKEEGGCGKVCTIPPASLAEGACSRAGKSCAKHFRGWGRARESRGEGAGEGQIGFRKRMGLAALVHPASYPPSWVRSASTSPLRLAPVSRRGSEYTFCYSWAFPMARGQMPLSPEETSNLFDLHPLCILWLCWPHCICAG